MTTGVGAEGTTVQPIFLLSMPRSGSTLAQRVLAAHPEVSTAAEPWLLLPHAYAMRRYGVAAEYTQPVAARAIREFVEGLPGGEQDYWEALRGFALELYGKAADPGARFFLDKTPRYHFIMPELLRMFPDAKVIFLWRNPLAVVASICETWTRGRWTVDRWRADLDGIVDLVDAYRELGDEAKAVNFESLVTDPSTEWPALFAWVGLEFDPDLLTSFAGVRMQGSMGDPTGVEAYRRLSTEPLDKWKRQLGSPWRKRWCRAWLDRIGAERLAVMGYDLDELVRDLDSLPSRPRLVVSDAINGGYWAWAQRRKRAAFKRMAPRLRRHPRGTARVDPRPARVEPPVARSNGTSEPRATSRSHTDRTPPPTSTPPTAPG